MDLTENAQLVLQKYFLQKGKNGKVCETPSEMFRRTAKTVAAVDKKFDPHVKLSAVEDEFYALMSCGEFLPNAPTLMNAGTELGQLSACFVLPVEDSIDGIFEALKEMALIHQSGGGVGFNFGKLRPKGSVVRKTHGTASGPVSFLKVFDAATNVIRQGGRRRGANMGILPVDHPDILEFISLKKTDSSVVNFNLSVGVSDQFMEAAKKGNKYSLKDPRTKKTCGSLDASDVLMSICEACWECGDPGLLFLDRINRDNPLKAPPLEATNPCGEQPLLPYESCNLGSINLSLMVKGGQVNYLRLKEVVHSAVHFLDNVIDANIFPMKEIETATLNTRKIGLGVMGFADMLIKLGVPYNSPKAALLAEKIMKFINDEGHKASQELGKKRGSFPAFKESIFRTKNKPMRNATVTTVAPTGTISILAGCSSGIEPLFAVSYVRKTSDGREIAECSTLFEQMLKKKKIWSLNLCRRVLNEGGFSEIPEIPDEIKSVFVTAHQIPYEWQVNIAAAFQKHADNGVSKTVNLPKTASKEDIKNIFLLAHKLKCKGITAFRSGCSKEGVLSVKPEDTGRIILESEFSGGCPASYCVD